MHAQAYARRSNLWTGFSIFVTLALSLATSLASAQSPDFEQTIAPLLIKNCLECHNANDSSGGLNLSSGSGLLKGGDSGAVLDRQHVDKSLLLERVTKGEMPPEKNGKPQTLTVDEQRLLAEWFTQGAPWPDGRTLELYERTTSKRGGRDWWSFQSLKDFEPGQSIDSLWQAELSSHGLTAAPPARELCSCGACISI